MNFQTRGVPLRFCLILDNQVPMLKLAPQPAQAGHKREQLTSNIVAREMYRLYAPVFCRRVCKCPAAKSTFLLRCGTVQLLQALQGGHTGGRALRLGLAACAAQFGGGFRRRVLLSRISGRNLCLRHANRFARESYLVSAKSSVNCDKSPCILLASSSVFDSRFLSGSLPLQNVV